MEIRTATIALFSLVATLAHGQNAPKCDLNQYLEPFWTADTIYDETVLMWQAQGSSTAEGNLLFEPTSVVSVKSYTWDAVYSEGLDYTRNGKVLTRTANSRIPLVKEADFSGSYYTSNFYNIQAKWASVTYTHKGGGDWRGPMPVFKGANLPKTLAKLVSKSPLKIVATGMSITAGHNVSGYGGDKAYPAIPPYMPTYIDLFAYALKKIYATDKINLVNNGVSGWTIADGVNNIQAKVVSQKPDLVIIDYGMNDFYGKVSNAQFKAAIQTMIDAERRDNPDCEFMLLSNMMPDSTYAPKGVAANMRGFSSALKSLEGPGIADLDMTAISDTLYARKRPKDCMPNPLHPNDYLARWYAQGMIALLDNRGSGTTLARGKSGPFQETSVAVSLADPRTRNYDSRGRASEPWRRRSTLTFRWQAKPEAPVH